MNKYNKIDYTNIELPEELLTSFAKALAPEIRKFYDSDEGKAYYERWLAKHPEYNNRTPDARTSGYKIRHNRLTKEDDYNNVQKRMEELK